MMVIALVWVVLLATLLAALGAAAVLHGADTRDSFADDRRR
jgi:hypothetical protein